MQDQPQTLELSRAEIKRLRQENESLQQQLRTFREQHVQLQAQVSARLNNILAFNPDSVFAITDAHGVLTYVHKNFCELSQYNREELIGHAHQIVNSDYYPNAFISELWQTVSKGNVWQGEIRNRAKDGSYYRLKLAICPLGDEKGTPVHYIYLQLNNKSLYPANENIDKLYLETQVINEELRASEEELRQTLDHSLELNEKLASSEAKYRLISESMRDMICLHHIDGIYTYISPSVKQLLGYQAEELLGQSPYGYFHPDDIERIKDDAHLKAQTGITNNQVEYRFRHKNGHYVWMETVTQPLINENGTIYALHTESRDITQRKQAEKERDNFFNYSIDILCIIDITGKIVRTNFAWVRTLGYTVQDTAGRSIQEFAHPDDLEKVNDALRSRMNKAEVDLDFEVRYRCKDGSYRWISWNSVPFPEEKLVYGFGRDITDLKQSEELARMADFSINHASDSIFWVGPDASIMRVNQTACRLLGYTQEELLQMKVPDINPNFSMEIWPAHWQDLREKKNMIMESLHRTKEGRIYPIEVSLSFFEFDGKEYNFAFARESTDRKQAEKELRFNSLILSRLNDAIVGVDMQYNINYWSVSAERQYGLKAQQVMGKPLSEAYTYEWLDPADENKTSIALQANGFCKFEVLQTLKSGKKLYVEMLVQRLEDLNGNNIGLFAIIHDITERKVAEQQLLEREIMLESVFNESSDALFLVVPGGKIIKCNKKAVELFGASTEEELKGKFGPSFHKHPFAEEDMRYMDDCIARDGVWSSEIEYISLTGNEFWGSITVKKVHIIDHIYQLVRISDITSRKQAQADLLQYAQRSINILESITDAMFILDRNWRITYFNKQAEHVLGEQRANVLNKNLWELYPAAAGTTFEQQYQKAFSLNTDVHFEEYYPLLDIWFEVHAYPSAEGLSVYFRKINQRKAAEKAIRESEERFRSLTTHSPVGIFTTTPDGLCTWSNPQMQKIAGFTFEEGLGDGWTKFVHPQDQERVFSEWRAYASSGLPLIHEYRFLHKDGTIRWVRGTTNAVLYDTSEEVGHVSTIEDITERREGEERLKSTLDELKRRNHELDNYVYKVSHDLRAPLTSIMGLVNLIKIEPDQQNIRNYIDLIENRVIKSDQFIHSILSHSKILNSQVQINAVDLRQIIIESFDQLKYMPLSDRLQVQINIEGVAEFWSDAFRVDIILKNFISNAIKYMNPQQPVSYVHFDITISEKEGIICISDNGLGIDQKYQPKIFDMFFRATEKSEGSGLGLYIVKQTIERMGGTIHMESEAGTGTTFTIVLPNLFDASGKTASNE